jgi:hypothetical protein
MSYAECLKKYYNAVDGTFYDAINAECSIGLELSQNIRIRGGPVALPKAAPGHAKTARICR